MDRKKRTEILIRGNKNLHIELAEQIKSKYKINVVEEPENGIVMIKMRETAKRELFYLGEVLVTEAKVSINGTLGMGIVVGDNEELALNLAIIDCAYKCNFEETLCWNTLLTKEAIEINKKEFKEASKILKTKVDFRTMDV
ncbi:phosphonate C-P lyase system protein PhnG [Clostridium sp.]|uniref:phosphonate C-P lyase system protein PhnG n=1 Tax=Clostridium sp. TaxID=1506 RepID=UPI0028FEDBA2|nr:phosphonate C-P lyase system protein PhnG [Clostridium sp.]MDU7261220.1 phosphonate C-P lyase system protein PhnG [Clostridium butyricum]MDU1067756.1 phosphonate C-P lyase system protein PhnG [Clostridium sp.]MDU2676941.1 phosphonate C-P lyase system protein PhnG [Clostridium sp.]MDU4211165.1 phosphonate C-P lyase system protein PhnG [Clostridium sp.]MDU5174010.1 phosphonate C-P lyase system protein PhnG [Clostridium sp.]